MRRQMNRGLCLLEHALIASENYKEALLTLKEKGVEGIVLNHIWNENYLKDKSIFERLNEIIDFAKSLNMNVWLYDEKGYPSGKAGGLVLKKNPDYQAKGITYLMMDRIPKQDSLLFEIPDDLEKILYAYVERKGETFAVPFEDRKILLRDVHANDCLHVICETELYEGSIAASSGTDEKYINIMDKNAVKSFIEITYDSYAQNIPGFGDKIDAIFTDEPALAEGYIFYELVKGVMWCPRGYKYAKISWCDGFDKEFERDHGYNPLTCGRRLFVGDDDKSALTRIHYRQTVARLVGEAYFGQIQSWCESHGTNLAGHINNEEYLHEHVMYYGNLYTTLDKMGYIGMDVLNGCIEELMYNDRRFIGNKFVGSLARIRDKTNVVMAEFCPVRDVAFTNLTQIKAVASYLYFCGVNYLNSYWKSSDNAEMRELSAYLKFLYSNLENKKKDGKIAVYYPIETMQGLVKPLYVQHEILYRSKEHIIGKLEEGVRSVVTDIWGRGLDFEFVDAVGLENAVMQDDQFSLSNMRFSVLLLPSVKYMSRQTYLRIQELEKLGVTVVWLGENNQLVLYDGNEIFYEKVDNRDYTDLQCLNALHNLISWKSTDRILYAEFIDNEAVTGMFVNNDNQEKTVCFEDGKPLTAVRFGKEELVKSSIKILPYETIFVTRSM